MYGTQAFIKPNGESLEFENDVNMYGTQAFPTFRRIRAWFENDVNIYGTQANPVEAFHVFCLRMM